MSRGIGGEKCDSHRIGLLFRVEAGESLHPEPCSIAETIGQCMHGCLKSILLCFAVDPQCYCFQCRTFKRIVPVGLPRHGLRFGGLVQLGAESVNQFSTDVVRQFSIGIRRLDCMEHVPCGFV